MLVIPHTPLFWTILLKWCLKKISETRRIGDFGAIITLLRDFSLSIRIQEEQLLYHHPRLIVFLFSCFMSCSMIWLFLLLCWPYLGDKRQIKSDKKIWVGRFSLFNWILAISFLRLKCSLSKYICQLQNVCVSTKNNLDTVNVLAPFQQITLFEHRCSN